MLTFYHKAFLQPFFSTKEIRADVKVRPAAGSEEVLLINTGACQRAVNLLEHSLLGGKAVILDCECLDMKREILHKPPVYSF